MFQNRPPAPRELQDWAWTYSTVIKPGHCQRTGRDESAVERSSPKRNPTLSSKVNSNKAAAEMYGVDSPNWARDAFPQTGPIVRPRLSAAPAAPWTRPCSSPWLTRLTRLDIV